MSEPTPACPVATVSRILGSRWTMLILHHLRKRRRYCELQAAVGSVNPTTFTQRLKLLERQGLIIRHTFPNNPRHVEYELTQAGRELLPILDSLAEWAQKWLLEQATVAPSRSGAAERN